MSKRRRRLYLKPIFSSSRLPRATWLQRCVRQVGDSETRGRHSWPLAEWAGPNISWASACLSSPLTLCQRGPRHEVPVISTSPPFSLITPRHIALGAYGRQILRADKMYKLLSTPQHISKSWKRIISNISTQLEPNIKIHTRPAWSRPRVEGGGDTNRTMVCFY